MNTSITNNIVYCFGEILWDILPDGPQPGGAPLNVIYHLNKLNRLGKLISRLGKDIEGKNLRKTLHQWKIDSNLIQSDPINKTGKVLTRADVSGDVNYEIVFPVAWDFIETEDQMMNEVKKASAFVYGSLAARNKESRNTLFRLLKQAPYKVLDINLRPPFFESGLLKQLLEEADLLKLNEEEFKIIGQMFIGNPASEQEKVALLQKRFDIGDVVITRGEQGASYYGREEVQHCRGISVKVRDTIGSGDSFLAAFLTNRLNGATPEISLKNAVAMGSFIASKRGGCPAYRPSDYLNFIKENHKL